ncbi:hypothetical protein BJV82DRAFT_606405 [Fennellomyces sp. T-0311]|nr:hypothetical protein BJV82DRAFT_606405 [Fennellomyces sp. T-0311]
MSKSFRLSLAFILTSLACLQGLGLYFFLKGFLLTRQTLDIHANHNDVWDQFPLHEQSVKPSNHPPTIPANPPFERVIVIVIDALRFDFIVPMPDKDEYYLNRLPIIEKLHREHPASSLLYQFRADPPTTTMQRVKGLMTGSLPTFIDAGANFDSSAVNEDHLLRHVRSRYDNIYFMGDDTWVNLYPEVFHDRNKTFESDSFKMFDLHTVDNRILERLWPLMEDQSDWQVAIAHFLGVDHCGHTYGPSHPSMASKLSQMNDVIDRLSQYVDEDTLLVVMGDHGMSVEGDHGGESVEELMSGLFLYSGRQLTLKDDYYQDLIHRLHSARTEKLGYPVQEIVDRLGYKATDYPIVSQIHLVPTLAYLLGIPIPFGNLGAVLPDVLVPNIDETPSTKQQILHHMAQQFRMNAVQVHRYLNAYWHHTEHPGFAPSALKPIYEHLWNAERMFAGLSDGDIETLERILFEYDTFLMSTIKYCEAIWAQFDVGSMVVGAVILVMTSCATLFSASLHRPTVNIKLGIILWLTTLTASLGGYLAFQNADIHGWFEKMGKADGLFAASCIAVAALFLTMTNAPKTPKQRPLSLAWISLVTGATVVACSLGSNSFVIWEDRDTRYIGVTLCVVWFAHSIATWRSPDKIALLSPVVVAMWIRITGETGQCREEQFPYCDYIHNGYLNFGRDAYLTIGYTIGNIILALFVLPLLFQAQVGRRMGPLLAYRISLVIVLLRQLADIYQNAPDAPQVDIPRHIAATIIRTLDVYAPRVIYILTIANTVYAVWTIRRNRKSSSWLLLYSWSTTLAMLQKPFGSHIILVVPVITKLLTYHQDPSTIYIRLAVVYTVGQHLYFATSHQATFTSLPWRAAFMGFDDVYYYAAMVLVALSTLSGPIVSWLSMLVLLSDELDPTAIRLSLYLMTALQSIPTSLSAIFVLILRRHLMTWKIFAPRFMLQGLLGMGLVVAAIIHERLLRYP